ncbi:MAG: VOC family protein [Pseudaminobacter sp.]|nr:VOC family protein [Pseudaminobacter sp.]
MSETARRKIATVSVLVADYEDAIAWYTEKLGFSLYEDADLGHGKRWVTVGPAEGGGARLLLAKAAGEEQRARIGDQAGGRVFLFLETDDFARDHQLMLERGVEFQEEPRDEAYGMVAVFADLYGNLWDLIGPRILRP